MRQIKFRGKRLDNGGWIVGSLLNIEDTYFIIEQNDFDFDYRTETTAFWFDCTEKEVNPETIGQFTGLHDKNGQKIYEGDLLEWDEFSHKKQGVVVWRDYGFCVVYYRPTGTEVRLVMAEFGDAEVVGNIHDDKFEEI